MKLDRIALALVVVAAIAYLGLLAVGLVAALPYAWPLLLMAAAGLYLLVRVIRDRMNNDEDDWYEKNVKD